MLRWSFAFGLGLTAMLSAQAGLAEDGQKNRGDRELPAQLLQKFDKNGDGKLDEAEKGAAKKAMEERRAAGKGPEGNRSASGLSEERRAELMKKFDKNGDGKLDETEREAAKKEMGEQRGKGGPGGDARRAEMMKKFDKNGDGKIDGAEREAARKALGDGAAGKKRPERAPGAKKPDQK